MNDNYPQRWLSSLSTIWQFITDVLNSSPNFFVVRNVKWFKLGLYFLKWSNLSAPMDVHMCMLDGCVRMYACACMCTCACMVGVWVCMHAYLLTQYLSTFLNLVYVQYNNTNRFQFRITHMQTTSQPNISFITIIFFEHFNIIIILFLF